MLIESSWTYNDNWPAEGEIDIVEGVNQQQTNRMAIHTGRDYTITERSFSGQLQSDNCNVYAVDQEANQGCTIVDQSNQSFGDTFNDNGGGIYAMEWTKTAIKIWFFPRGTIPSNLYSTRPQSNLWGAPRAIFRGEKPISDLIGPQKIVNARPLQPYCD